MPLQEALAFLGQARRREDVTEALAALDGQESWEALAEIASQAGFDCTPDELSRAFALDWRLRWVRYHPQPAAPQRRGGDREPAA